MITVTDDGTISAFSPGDIAWARGSVPVLTADRVGAHLHGARVDHDSRARFLGALKAILIAVDPCSTLASFGERRAAKLDRTRLIVQNALTLMLLCIASLAVTSFQVRPRCMELH